MCLEGDVEVVKLFLKAGIRPDAKCWDTTALRGAACHGHTEVVKVLIEAGADVNAKDKNGRNALQVATRKHNDDIVQILREAGAKE